MAALEVFSNEHVVKLRDRNVRVVRGFNSDVVNALHRGIQDSAITEFTHDAERFATRESTIDWYEQSGASRRFYSLVDTAIKGIIWFGPSKSEHSEAESTFAIRMYASGRSKGLAGDFMEAAHEDFVTVQGGGDTWLKVKPANLAAQSLYLKHGYEITHEAADGIIMTRRAVNNVG